jgi:hypothetical protein
MTTRSHPCILRDRAQRNAVGDSRGSGTDRCPSITAGRPDVHQGQHRCGRGVRGHGQWPVVRGRAGRSVQAAHTHLPRSRTEL